MVNPTGNSREYRTGYFRVEPEQTPSVGSSRLNQKVYIKIKYMVPAEWLNQHEDMETDMTGMINHDKETGRMV